jgi:uncharacterized protein (UPF0332 family)
VKPQSDAFLEKARTLLEQAEMILRVGLADVAGRMAYLAGYHAAQAFIFERGDRVIKTHNGVQAEFGRLIKDDPRFGAELRAFLGRAYNLKAIADYETGPGAKISHVQAVEAITAAYQFLDTIQKAIGSSEPPSVR